MNIKNSTRIVLILFSCVAIKTFVIKTEEAKEPAPIRRESANIITLFMKPYEQIKYDPSREIDKELSQIKIEKNIVKHHKSFLQNTFEYATDPQGLYVLYGGFVDIIDTNRQVRFPRLTQEDEITLIITRQLHPYIKRGNTVDIFRRELKDAIACYKFKRHFDQKNNFYYWDVQTINMSNTKTIPSNAMIIFANPAHIFVPLEETIAVPGADLVLPIIYATQDIKKDYNAIAFMNISRYFDPITYITKIAPPMRYAQKIANT